MSDSCVIGENSKVTLHYALAMEDGTVIDSTFEGTPISFTMGDGTMIEGLEAVLMGLKTDDSQSVSIPPQEGFGFPDAEAIQVMPLDEFPADMAPQAGQIIAFNMPNGEEIPGTVLDVTAANVKIDFNHPLAGHEVICTVRVVAMENTAPENSD